MKNKSQNFYNIIGLDPFVRDLKTISKRINELQAQWKEYVEKYDDTEYKRLLELLPDIKKCLLNEELRDNEANEAMFINSLDDSKEAFCAKINLLAEVFDKNIFFEDIKKISVEFVNSKFTNEEVDKFITLYCKLCGFNVINPEKRVQLTSHLRKPSPPSPNLKRSQYSDFEINGKKLIDYTGNAPVVEVPTGVTVIGELAFNYPKKVFRSNRKEIFYIILPDSITKIENHAFWSCSNLKYIDIPSSVNVMGSDAFAYCDNLEYVNFPSGLSSIPSGTFGYCKNLLYVILPDKVEAFEDSSFYFCSSLTEITLPDTIKVIGKSAFQGCNNLLKINIPQHITTINEKTFYNCHCLSNVLLPSGLKTIKKYAFAGCKFSEIALPENLNTIDEFAFAGCSELSHLTIPKSIQYIGKKAFMNCNSLKEVTLQNSHITIDKDAFPKNISVHTSI